MNKPIIPRINSQFNKINNSDISFSPRLYYAILSVYCQ